jgi:hypothetical protein
MTQAVSSVASDGLPSLDATSFRNVPRPARDAVKGRGVHFGRPRKLNLEQEKLAQQLISEETLVREIAEIFNVHAATIYGDSDVAA